MDVKEQYSIMFTNYPDIINIEQKLRTIKNLQKEKLKK